MTNCCDPCGSSGTSLTAGLVSLISRILVSIDAGFANLIVAIQNIVITGIGGTFTVTAAVFGPMVDMAAAALTNAYAAFAVCPADTKSITFSNQTNGDVAVSLDGGASNTLYLEPGERFTYQLYSNGLITAAIVFVKYGTVVPSLGYFRMYSVS